MWVTNLIAVTCKSQIIACIKIHFWLWYTHEEFVIVWQCCDSALEHTSVSSQHCDNDVTDVTLTDSTVIVISSDTTHNHGKRKCCQSFQIATLCSPPDSSLLLKKTFCIKNFAYFGCHLYPCGDEVLSSFCCCSQKHFMSSGTSLLSMPSNIDGKSLWSHYETSLASASPFLLHFSPPFYSRPAVFQCPPSLAIFCYTFCLSFLLCRFSLFSLPINTR